MLIHIVHILYIYYKKITVTLDTINITKKGWKLKRILESIHDQYYKKFIKPQLFLFFYKHVYY